MPTVARCGRDRRRIDRLRIDAIRGRRAHGREGGAECGPDHPRQCRQFKLGIFKKHGLDLKIVDLSGGSQNGAGPGGRRHRYRRRRRHRDGAGRQGRADDRGLRDRGAGAVPQRRRAVRFAASHDCRSQGQEDRRLHERLADRLADQGAGTPPGMGADRRHRGRHRQRRGVDHRGVPRQSRRRRYLHDIAVPHHGRAEDRAHSRAGDAVFGQSRRRRALCVATS